MRGVAVGWVCFAVVSSVFFALSIKYIMDGVNHIGLIKRDTNDDIVALIDAGEGVIKYPDRVASRILSSPYMKQIDGEPQKTGWTSRS